MKRLWDDDELAAEWTLEPSDQASLAPGLRTTALVATGACLFVILSVVLSATSNADRIAAQVVSGVGFLGAGVIIRDGFGIRGLNTAATLWCAAAVGSLAGAGFFVFAVVGSVAIVLANQVLRLIARQVDVRTGSAAEVETAYASRAVCRATDEAHVRVLLVQSLSGSRFTLSGLSSQDINASGRVEVQAMLVSQEADQARLEQAVSRLSLEPGVSAVSWHVTEPTGMGVDGDTTATADVTATDGTLPPLIPTLSATAFGRHWRVAIEVGAVDAGHRWIELTAHPRSGHLRDAHGHRVRFDTVRSLPVAALDRVSGRVEVITNAMKPPTEACRTIQLRRFRPL